MPQRILPALFVLGVIALVWMAWQPAPAMAGFTPTPPPPPTNTPTPPTPQPPPPTSEKPPKDTPVPTATVNLTATPGVLPVAGGKASDDGRIAAIPFLAFIFIAAIEIVVRRSRRANVH